MSKRYRIEHDDGRTFDVSRDTFNRLYKPAGFRIVANADGSAVDQPRAAKAPRGPRQRSAAARKGAKARVARPAAAAAASSQAIDSSAAAGDPDPEDAE